MAILYKFFNSFPYWRMQPFTGLNNDAVGLFEKGRTYIVNLPHGGDIPVDLSSVGPMESSWFNPRTSNFSRSDIITSGFSKKFKAPDNKDWVLLLTASSRK